MTAATASVSASKPARGGSKQQQPQQQTPPPAPRKNSSSSEKGDDDPVLQSISSNVRLLLTPSVTLTCYIPTQAVGAVIGRGGSKIAHIQRSAQQLGTVRVSIVGHDEDPESIPYTFSDLDWSSPDWTPVVIRGDPCASLTAAQYLEQYSGGELDDVVLDVPLSRTKHATVVGKRGVVIQEISADTNVRMMVPRRGLRHDVIQLEGELENVKICLERVLSILSASVPRRKPLEESAAVQVSTLPTQTKLRNVSRKTDTSIQKKKQEDDSWVLTIAGAQQEQVQAAVAMLEKWKEDNANNAEGKGVTSPQRRVPQRRQKKSVKKGGKGGTPTPNATTPEQPSGSN